VAATPARETLAQDDADLALEWIKYYHEEKVEWLYPEPPREWVGRWRTLIDGQDLERGLRAYEAAALWGVRRAPRNGSLWSPYGYECSNPAQNLMPAALWQQKAQSYRDRKDLPTSAIATWLEPIVGRRVALPISTERARVYARRFRRRRSSDVRELPPFRQELEAICFAVVTLGTLADDLLRLVEMRIAAIWNWAHRIATDELMPARTRSRGAIIAELRQLVADPSLTDTTYRSRSAELLLPHADTAVPCRQQDAARA